MGSNPNQWSQQQVNQASGTNIPVRPNVLEPTLEVTQQFYLWGSTSNPATENTHYQKFTGGATQYTGGMAGVLGQASASLFYFEPVVMGKTRRYVVFRRKVGGMAPHSLQGLLSAFGEAMDAIGSFGLSLVTWDINQGRMEGQAVPMHHVGHIKVETRVIGTSYEGDATTVGYGVANTVNALIVDDVYTGLYHEYLGAKRMYDDLYLGLSDVDRRIAHVEAVYQGRVRDGSMTRGEAYQELQSLNNIRTERQNDVNRGTHSYQLYCRNHGWDWHHPPPDPRRAPPPQ